MKSRTLSKSERRDLSQDLFQEYGIELFGKKDMVLEIETEVGNFLRVNGDDSLFHSGNVYIPTLVSLLKNNFLKKITVDMGAVKFVASGADIMRPGVVECDEGIIQGEYVTIIDVNNKRPLAVGQTLLTGADIMASDSGKVIKNIHYVGDKIWNQCTNK